MVDLVLHSIYVYDKNYINITQSCPHAQQVETSHFGNMHGYHEHHDVGILKNNPFFKIHGGCLSKKTPFLKIHGPCLIQRNSPFVHEIAD